MGEAYLKYKPDRPVPIDRSEASRLGKSQRFSKIEACQKSRLDPKIVKNRDLTPKKFRQWIKRWQSYKKVNSKP